MRKNKIIITAVVLTAIIAGGTFASKTYASFTSGDKVTNHFTTGSVVIENHENGGTDPITKTDWDKGNTAKKVTVKNIGKSPVLIRVAISPRWVNSDNSPFAGDTSLNVVKINFTEGYQNNWTFCDGYYYYNTVVNPDNITKPLIDSVSAVLPPKLQDRYKGKKLIIDVHSEAVLASVIDSSANPKVPVYTKTWKDISNTNLQTRLNNLSGVK